jgi:hypothetical protein
VRANQGKLKYALAYQGRATAMPAHRFFGTDRMGGAIILAGHSRATRERVAAANGTILVLHGTTEFFDRQENAGLLHRPKHGPSGH